MRDFFKEAKDRGFIYQCTDEEGLKEAFSKGRVTAYLGFDPTAASLHVGHLVGIMYLRLLQKHGHRPIALFGGGTAKIGDPTGKEEMRQFLDDATIQKNIDGIRPVFQKFIELDASDALLVNNNDWLSGIGYLEFLRDIGKHFSVNRMLTFDSVKTRLEREQNLTFLEFNYSILQAYDFLELYNTYGCTLQLGGSDQWGNIVSGVELVRKALGKQVFGLTAPLVTTSSGAKMGKTVKGAVWLNQELLSPYDYWQFWRNTEDNDVIRYLKLFTDLPMNEIQKLESLKGQEINEAKKILADEATSLLHGNACIASIHDAVKSLFESKSTDLSSIPEILVQDISDTGINIVDLFVQAGLSASKGEARRLMQGGGMRVNDQVIDAEIIYTPDQFPLKLSSGKKKHLLATLSP